MFINKIVDSVLIFSACFSAIFGYIAMLIIRFHMLHKIEKNVGGELKIPKEFKTIPFFIAVVGIINLYFFTRLLNKFGMRRRFDQANKWHPLLKINYPIEKFSWFDLFVVWVFWICGIWACLVGGLVYFKIIT